MAARFSFVAETNVAIGGNENRPWVRAASSALVLMKDRLRKHCALEAALPREFRRSKHEQQDDEDAIGMAGPSVAGLAGDVFDGRGRGCAGRTWGRPADGGHYSGARPRQFRPAAALSGAMDDAETAPHNDPEIRRQAGG